MFRPPSEPFQCERAVSPPFRPDIEYRYEKIKRVRALPRENALTPDCGKQEGWKKKPSSKNPGRVGPCPIRDTSVVLNCPYVWFILLLVLAMFATSIGKVTLVEAFHHYYWWQHLVQESHH
jgi:hypothetical protein